MRGDFVVELKQFLQWEQATRDTIDLKKIYVDMAEDLVSGVLLSQIVYWFLPNKEGRTKLRVKKAGVLWLAKGREDWWDECRIIPRQFDTAIKKLESKGLIEKKVMKFNGETKVHIRIIWDIFLETLQVELAKTEQRDREQLQQENNQQLIEKEAETLDANGIYEIVNQELQSKSLDRIGNYKSVNPEKHIGESGLSESVNLLTESTTETTTKMVGRKGEEKTSHDMKQDWISFKQFCQKYQIDQVQILEFWKTYHYHYPDAPVMIVINTLKELLHDKWQRNNKGQWTEQEYKNITGLFHHRMKSWEAMIVAFEDIDSEDI